MRAGWYGREGERRQRCWCQPKTGERHGFTEILPRITAGYRGTAARDDRGRSVVAAVEALPKLSIAAWDRFLRTLEGQPQ